MDPMWWKLIKVLFLLFALFATIVCINSHMPKRRSGPSADTDSSADMSAFVSHHVLNAMSTEQQEAKHDQQSSDDRKVELPAEDINERIHSLFKVQPGDGVILFNTTALNSDASLMPISSALGEPPGQTQTHIQAQSQSQSAPQAKPQHHQYQSSNHQQQSFKVQRSPDGRLNLVFNEPLVSLQSTTQRGPEAPGEHPQGPTQHPISDTFVFPDSIHKSRKSPAAPTTTGPMQCTDGFNQSRSFCTEVNDYPDLTGLKPQLMQRFANFFSDEQPLTEIGLRMNVDETYLCNSHVRILYPKMGQVADNSWRYIVNTDEFKQGILIEECDNDGAFCEFIDRFPNNYAPVCKQHYVIRHMATINNQTDGQLQLANEPIRIPSCCKCVMRPKFSLDNL